MFDSIFTAFLGRRGLTWAFGHGKEAVGGCLHDKVESFFGACASQADEL